MLRKVTLVAFIFSIALLGFQSGQNASKFLFHVANAQVATKDGAANGREERYKNLELFQKVLHFVESNYVDEVNNTALVQGAIKGMLETLDPHSNFLPPEVFRDMKIDTSGQFGGLGIEIGVKDSILTVIAPIEDTPAWKAGLKPGDRIVKIEGTSTKGMTLVEAVSKMRGKRGSPVKLGIFRKGFKNIMDVSVVREIITISPVKSEELEAGFGYIRLKSFSEHAAKDMKKAIAKFEKKAKLQGLIFDMRSTPGGLLEQAVEVSSLFIKDGVIVSTIGRDKNQKEVKHARGGESARTDFPIVILVDSSTASAAEIVAGALQDHKRAVVMGQPTFGKGSVQTVIEVGDDMGLKLTVARYFTPNGRSIQEKGLAPDILLDEYDDSLLAKAKIKRGGLREENLVGHLKSEGTQEGDFSKEELEGMVPVKEESSAAEPEQPAKTSDADDMKPLKMDPLKDSQVREALNYLKSFEIFKKLAPKEATT